MSPRAVRFRVGALLTALLLACRDEPAPADDPKEEPAPPPPPPPNLGGEGPTPPPSTEGCAEAAKLPYVLSRTGDLHRFDVPNGKFDKIGTLDCAMNLEEETISMAVDRGGTAWVSTTQGKLLKVDVRSAKCERLTAFDAASFGWRGFGMGFAVDRAGASEETLFIAELTDDPIEFPSKGLGKLAIAGATAADNPAFTKVGDYTGDFAGASSELTGTGDGRLYAFVVQDGVTRETAALVQLDKATGAAIETVPLELKVNLGYAFSFWGGDFWFYTSPADADVANSQVTRLRYLGDKSESVAVGPIGFEIIGAGVSTCAPTTAVN